MKNLLSFILISTVFFTSCEIKDVDFEGVEAFKMENINTKQANFKLGVKVKNDNGFGIKIKPSKIDLLVNGKSLGELRLKNKVKLKRKTSNVYDVSVQFDFANGAMMRMMSILTKKEVQLQFKGKVKGGVFIFSKKIDINQSKTIETGKLKENFKLN